MLLDKCCKITSVKKRLLAQLHKTASLFPVCKANYKSFATITICAKTVKTVYRWPLVCRHSSAPRDEIYTQKTQFSGALLTFTSHCQPTQFGSVYLTENWSWKQKGTQKLIKNNNNKSGRSSALIIKEQEQEQKRKDKPLMNKSVTHIIYSIVRQLKKQVKCLCGLIIWSGYTRFFFKLSCS